MLLHEIAPLMQWRNIGGSEAAHKFDLLVCRLQTEHLKKSSSFDDLKAELLDQLGDLRMNLSQVKAVARPIAEARTNDFWTGVTVGKLEDMRGNYGASCSTGKAVAAVVPAAEGHRHQGRPVPDRTEEARRQAGRLAACRLPQPGREGAAGLVRDERHPASGSRRAQPVSEADLEALILAGADPRPDARPARPGGILSRLCRPTGPGDPQHHRPGCGGGPSNASRPSSSSTT